LSKVYALPPLVLDSTRVRISYTGIWCGYSGTLAGHLNEFDALSKKKLISYYMNVINLLRHEIETKVASSLHKRDNF